MAWPYVEKTTTKRRFAPLDRPAEPLAKHGFRMSEGGSGCYEVFRREDDGTDTVITVARNRDEAAMVAAHFNSGVRS